MHERTSGLQRTLAVFTAALVVLTTWQHHASVTLAAQIDLLLHERTDEASRHREREEELFRRLTEMQTRVSADGGGRDIEITAKRREHERVIAVTDYGIGVSAEVQARARGTVWASERRAPC